MKAIISGANGFIGKMLSKALIEKGYQIIALDVKFDEELLNNNSIKCINVLNKKMNSLINEIGLGEFDCFFHLAWVGTSGPNRANYKIQLDNVKNTCDSVVLAKKIGCKRIVYASSINEMETYEYLQSDNIEPIGGYIYGTGKLAAHLMGETVAKINNIEFLPVIITNIYGVGEKSARMIYTSVKKLINGEHCSFTEGFQMYDFIYLSDAINSIIEVSVKGKAFNRYYIGSGNPRPLRDFLLEMRDVVDSSAEIGLGDLPFNGVNISYDQFDLKKVERDTGYTNKISFKDGIALLADYIRNGEK